MATLTHDGENRWRIVVECRDGKHRPVRLRATGRQAETVRGHVAELERAALSGTAPKPTTAAWTATVGHKLHERMAKALLVEPRTPVEVPRLGAFIADYIASRTDLKPGSLAVLRQAQGSLVEHFGTDRAMGSITPGDADGWRLAMLAAGLAEATVRKRTQAAKQVYRAAIRRRLVVDDPFADLPSGSRANPSRLRFIDRATIQKVIDACPDAQWRLIVALARYAGLRVPSELLALTWGHVDWEHGRLTIPSPKTQHHEGREQRIIPLFPELRPCLQAVFDDAPEGTTFIITRYRQSNANLRTQLDRIIAKAGVDSWPKPFHNLRATRETELAQTFPIHVVCRWIGNTERIADRHYLSVTDADFQKAVGTWPAAPVASGPNGPADDSRKRRAPAARGVHALTRTDAHGKVGNTEKTSISREPLEVGMGALGFEPRTEGL